MIDLVKTIVSENGVKVSTDNKERNWQVNISCSIFTVVVLSDERWSDVYRRD